MVQDRKYTTPRKEKIGNKMYELQGAIGSKRKMKDVKMRMKEKLICSDPAWEFRKKRQNTNE